MMHQTIFSCFVTLRVERSSVIDGFRFVDGLEAHAPVQDKVLHFCSST